MKLIVGLGNPGRRYAGTRHNVGFDVLDTIAERHRLEWESAPAEALTARWRLENVMLAKPLTFMNLSGGAIVDLLQFYKIDRSDLLVVVDDINIELARLRATTRRIRGWSQRSQVGDRATRDRGLCTAEDRRRAWRCATRALGSRAGDVRRR